MPDDLLHQRAPCRRQRVVHARPTTPAGRGTPTPATAARRPGCSCGRSSGRCPTMRLARISVDLGRPVPMAGFTIAHRGRRGPGGRRRTRPPRSSTATARSGPRRPGCTSPSPPTPIFEARLDNSGARHAAPRRAVAGRRSRSARVAHDQPGFRDAVEIRYPPGEDNGPGRDDGVDAHRAAAPGRGDVAVPADQPAGRLRQRVRPPRRAGRGAVRQHRPASSPCTATRSASGWAAGRRRRWQPTGNGLAEALLFDDEGPVGRALQTLLLRPAAGMTALRDALADVVGPDHVLDDPDVTASYARDWTGPLPRRGAARRAAGLDTRRSPACCGRAPTPACRSSRRAATPGSSAAACPRGEPMVVLSTRRLTSLGRRRRRRLAGHARRRRDDGRLAPARPGRRASTRRSTSPAATRRPSAAPSPPTPAARGSCASARCGRRSPG